MGYCKGEAKEYWKSISSEISKDGNTIQLSDWLKYFLNFSEMNYTNQYNDSLIEFLNKLKNINCNNLVQKSKKSNII